MSFMNHALAVIGLGALLGAWVLFQRWIARHDPDAPGVEGRKGCAGSCTPRVRRDRPRP
jgi:hypothetical protein